MLTLVSRGLVPSKNPHTSFKKNTLQSHFYPRSYLHRYCYQDGDDDDDDDDDDDEEEEEEDNYQLSSSKTMRLTSRASWQAWRRGPRAVAPLLRTPRKYPEEDEWPNVMPKNTGPEKKNRLGQK